jgi:hypothetical protein
MDQELTKVSEWQLYTDSPPKMLRYHLGKPEGHTIYEAEAVGLTLAAKILLSLPHVCIWPCIYPSG